MQAAYLEEGKSGKRGKLVCKPQPWVTISPSRDSLPFQPSWVGRGWGEVQCPGDSRPSVLRQSWVEAQMLSLSDGEDQRGGEAVAGTQTAPW